MESFPNGSLGKALRSQSPEQSQRGPGYPTRLAAREEGSGGKGRASGPEITQEALLLLGEGALLHLGS